jgi:colicin import membrane protein
LSAAAARANDSAAHSIADRFAHDTDSSQSASDKDRQALERKLEDEARLKADEAEMLERAKAEAADQARAADSKRRAEEQRLAAEKAASERAAKEAADQAVRDAEQQRLAAEKAEAERRAAEDAARLAEEKRKAEEELAEDKAARERAAREAARIKDAETQRLATEKANADRLAAQKVEAERLASEKADAERLASEKAEAGRREIEAAKARIESARQADEKRQQDADAQRRMEADREEEARRLSEKLARAREQRAAKELGEGYSALGNPPQPDREADPAAAQGQAAAPAATALKIPQPVAAEKSEGVALASEGETRATILLVMEPGTRGIRRYEKTADPILCIGEHCYVGNGVEQTATAMTRGRAFGPGNTLGQRAGACRHSLVCVFRDVPVGAGRFDVQPIDMRILRHDRREKISVETDRSCTAAGGYLRCSKGSQSASYRLWIVPESVARQAGSSALSAALSGGLPAATAAELRR